MTTEDIDQEENEAVDLSAVEVTPSEDEVVTEQAELEIVDDPQEAANMDHAPIDDEAAVHDEVLTAVEVSLEDAAAVASEDTDEDVVNYDEAAADVPTEDAADVATEGILQDDGDAAEVVPKIEAIAEEAELGNDAQVAVGGVAKAPVNDVVNDEAAANVPAVEIAADASDDAEADGGAKEDITGVAKVQSELLVNNPLLISSASVTALGIGVAAAAANAVSNDEDEKKHEIELVQEPQLDLDEKESKETESNHVSVDNSMALNASTAHETSVDVMASNEDIETTLLESDAPDVQENPLDLRDNQNLPESHATTQPADILENVSDEHVVLPDKEGLIAPTQGDAVVNTTEDSPAASTSAAANTADNKRVTLSSQPGSSSKPPTVRSTSVSKSSKYSDPPKTTTMKSAKIRVSTSVDEYQLKASSTTNTKAAASFDKKPRTSSRNKRSTSSTVSKRKSSQYLDQPKTTTFSSAMLRAAKSADDYTLSKRTVSTSESRFTSRSNQQSSSRSKSRSSSCGCTIHIHLYEQSLAQQEEGRKRRHQVQEYLSWRNAERSGKFASCTSDFDRLQHHRTLNNYRRESFQEEFLRPKKKILLEEAKQLYQRLLAHKLKIEERRKQLREEWEAREVQWMREKFQRKLSLEEATRLYYNETALTRSRSRGRAWFIYYY